MRHQGKARLIDHTMLFSTESGSVASWQKKLKSHKMCCYMQWNEPFRHLYCSRQCNFIEHWEGKFCQLSYLSTFLSVNFPIRLLLNRLLIFTHWTLWILQLIVFPYLFSSLRDRNQTGSLNRAAGYALLRVRSLHLLNTYCVPDSFIRQESSSRGKKRDQGTPSWDWHCSRRETPNKQKPWCWGLISIRKKSRSGERQGRGGSAAGPSRPEWRQGQGVRPPSAPSRAEVSKENGEGGDTFSENGRAASEAAVQGEQ